MMTLTTSVEAVMAAEEAPLAPRRDVPFVNLATPATTEREEALFP